MTVSYNLDISSVSAFSFLRLLFRWRGSIWKSMSTELFIWLCGYYIVFFVYRNLLTIDNQRQFEKVAMYCESKLSYIPLTFMLGFFVTIVVDRWRNIFVNMGWIENLALTVATLLRGDSKEAVLYRRSIIRYAVLCQVLVFRDVSMRVRRRFPNMESIVVAGFLHENELRDLENIKMVYNKYWAPFNWALTICTRAYKEGCIENIPAMVAIQNEVKLFRTSLAQLCHFDWVPIPIAYPQVLFFAYSLYFCTQISRTTIELLSSGKMPLNAELKALSQVVFLAVRVYFVICTVSRQFILSADAKNRSALFRVAKPEEHVKMVAVDVGKHEEGDPPKSHKPSLADKIADICCVPKRRTSVYPVSQSAVHLVHYGDSPRQAIRRQPRATQADAKTNHKPTTDNGETRKLSNAGLTTISEESDSRKSSAESEVKMNDMSRH
ncbi:unnamed protein product [Haemonchus placei]|uniref:Bestrophin homolog n=1 Tax=Haemonchus placei TaxID=6290 RepID=A0A0N4WIG3_HAEPC|nr:unnamed protein product [Haemonchus placei]